MARHPSPKPRLEIQPPDITPYAQGNTGIEYVTTLDSGRPGPHVMINALTHGNELCGAHALCYLFEQQVHPVRGRLTLSFANVEAFRRFNPDDPYASRFVDEDFNRLWSEPVLANGRSTRELARARALLRLIDQADLLLDIHSMHLSAPPLLLCGVQQRALDFGRAMGYPAYLVRDRGHAAGRRLRDYGAFDDPAGHRTALLIECGHHWARFSVDVAIETALRFLRQSQVLDPAFFKGRIKAAPSPQTVVEVSGPVTIKTLNFRFLQDFTGLEVIDRANTLIGYDGEEEVRTPYDRCVLVMPGRQLHPGLSAVRFGRIVG